MKTVYSSNKSKIEINSSDDWKSHDNVRKFPDGTMIIIADILIKAGESWARYVYPQAFIETPIVSTCPVYYRSSMSIVTNGNSNEQEVAVWAFDVGANSEHQIVDNYATTNDRLVRLIAIGRWK